VTDLIDRPMSGLLDHPELRAEPVELFGHTITREQVQAVAAPMTMAVSQLYPAEAPRVVFIHANIPAAMSAVVDQINTLLRLPSRWDCVDARPLDADAAVTGLRLLAAAGQLAAPPSIGVMPNGGLHLEWNSDTDGVEVEVQPGPGCAISVVVDENGGITEWQPATVGDVGIRPALERILRARP